MILKNPKLYVLIAFGLMILAMGAYYFYSKEGSNEIDYYVSVEPSAESCDEIAKLNSEILTLIQDKDRLYCQRSSDCSSLAYGKASCGGPSSYYIYSTKWELSGEFAQLIGKANGYGDACSKYRENDPSAQPSIGICEYKSKPDLSCESNFCTKFRNSE